MQTSFRITVLVGLVLFAPPARAQVQLVDAFPDLAFTAPVDIQAPHDGSDRLFIVERRGVVMLVQNDPATATTRTFLDLRSQVEDGGLEQGLLGFAFHPQFPDTPHVYVNFTASGPSRTVIARFSVGADPDTVEAGSQFDILEVGQPFWNHNAGQLAFGPDGFLYIGMGDGGSAGDPLANGQNRQTLLGSMLRIDIDSIAPPLNYTIPNDNPYVGNASGYREEIYAYGFRNPWRYSFDSVTGWLWLGDVGQEDHEEVDVVTKGGNYGWNTMEGNACYDPPAGCDMTGLIRPVWVYDHIFGHRSITGGYVYRGGDIPAIEGLYIYADAYAGTIYALAYDGINPAVNALLLDTNQFISSFGVDPSGKLYLANLADGKIYRFDPIPTGIGDPPPAAAPLGRLGRNAPNPASPRTEIAFEVFGNGRTVLDVFDVRGRHVTTLVREWLPQGPHKAVWDGRNARGKPVASGVYFYRLQLGERTAGVRRLVLVR